MRRMFSENQIKEMIEENPVIEQLVEEVAKKADKITNNDIGYDTENSNVIFPSGVIPLKIFSPDLGHYAYFDYNNNKLVDEENTPIDDVNLFSDISTKQVIINIENAQLEISELVYINATYLDTLEDTLGFNTYYLFYPKPSGTKLYKHTISIDGDVLTFVSNFNRHMTIGDLRHATLSDFILVAFNGLYQVLLYNSGTYVYYDVSTSSFVSKTITSSSEITDYTDLPL